ncbi:siderophore-interacting protein [Roseovarius sp. SK2]|uniref:siderophore-interacting protein n=1 Tax=Roseovarius TaxID=74030 RepID=UPI00237C0344|nr:siderophore-interacting protein [Roseovarius sp. SK2]MDD9727151.1 siderophore-interacting protein [Roseovarius sp. SK2]
MSKILHANALFRGTLPDDAIPHISAHAREVELPVEETEAGLLVRPPLASVSLEVNRAGLQVHVEAADAAALQNIRDYLHHILDHVAPGLTQSAKWEGDIQRNRAPLNFCTATVQDVRRVGPHFLRVTLDCADTLRLSEERGMHFSLLLPPEGRTPIWPHLDANGRTRMPVGDDQLHRAAYTFVDLDPGKGQFTFDVFEHDGGRATRWARTARPGHIVGISGPGSGGFPNGRNILIAGDETALPAIRRILKTSAPDRRGHAILEVGTDDDICDLARPDGIDLTWCVRQRSERLWDHLSQAPLPPGPDRYVWVAAEKSLVRDAKARFRHKLGLDADQGYFAYYWEV